MITNNCIYCGKDLNKKSPGLLFCNNKCQNKALTENPEYYFEEINKIKNRKLDYKKKLLATIKEIKKEDMKHYKENGEYVIRNLTLNNKTGDAFGITLPKSVVKNHDRMVCKIISKDLIVLIPKYKKLKRGYKK